MSAARTIDPAALYLTVRRGDRTATVPAVAASHHVLAATWPRDDRAWRLTTAHEGPLSYLAAEASLHGDAGAAILGGVEVVAVREWGGEDGTPPVRDEYVPRDLVAELRHGDETLWRCEGGQGEPARWWQAFRGRTVADAARDARVRTARHAGSAAGVVFAPAIRRAASDAAGLPFSRAWIARDKFSPARRGGWVAHVGQSITLILPDAAEPPRVGLYSLRLARSGRAVVLANA